MITVEEIIKKEGADDDSMHSKMYAQALRKYYGMFCGLSITQLHQNQQLYRAASMGALPTHENIAPLMVLHFLLEDKNA